MKKAWNSLDFHVRNEPFQGVALTPGYKDLFLVQFLKGVSILAWSADRVVHVDRRD